MKKVILVGLNTIKYKDTFAEAMHECVDLAKACSYEVVYTISQKMDYADRQTCVGSGKLIEIAEQCHKLEVDKVIFLNRLSSSQISNINEACGIEVMDRTGLILEIFASRAKTKEAQIQVEMATLKYELPRLGNQEFSNDQQRGGTGVKNKGKGETKLELNRRSIERRISQLSKELKALEMQTNIQKQQRVKSELPLVALIGYTNAGKSSLMNKILELNESDDEKLVMEKDMLFATLDTSVRNITLKNKKEFLLFDTVGFVSDLPTELIEAFKSTLSAASEATCLLHVIDSSNHQYEQHVEATEKTLSRINANEIPVIKVYNKLDCISTMEKSDGIYVSCKTGAGLQELLDEIEMRIYPKDVTILCRIRYEDLAMMDTIKQSGTIEFVRDEEDGRIIRVTCSNEVANQISKYQIKGD